MIVPVHADDLLREIGIAVHVLPPGGDGDGQVVPVEHGGEGQAGQNPFDLLPRHKNAEQRFDLLNARRHLAGGEVGGADVLGEVRDRAAIQLFDEVQGARHPLFGGIGGHSLLEAEGGIRTLPQRAGSPAHAVAREFRGFEEHVFRPVRNFAVQPAHDPRERHGLFPVADDEIIGAEGKLLFVERRDLLPLFRAAHDDLSAADLVRVERVHGLPHFQKDEIGDVHDGGDGAQPRQRQPAAHPGGRLAPLHVLHVMTDIAGAEVGRLHLDGDRLFLRLVFGIRDVRLFQGLFQHRRHFARDPQNTLAVGAVRRDGDVENPIVQPHDLADVLPHGRGVV